MIRKVFWAIPFLLLLLQLPFLGADPDAQISHSRDANSDEGLNTSQVRNFVNGHGLNAWECDNLVKNPLFNTLLAPPLYLFGTHREVARAVVLLFVLGIFCLMGAYTQQYAFYALFGIFGLTAYPLFHYSHFSLAEMCSVISLVAALGFAWKLWEDASPRLWDALGFVVFVLASWYFKIQFAYSLILLPLILGFIFIEKWIKTRKFPSKWIKITAFSAVFAISGLILYYLCWYLQVKGAFDLVMQNQTSGRFADSKSWDIIPFENFNRIYPEANFQYVFLALGLGIPLGWILYAFPSSKPYRKIWILGCIWLLVEMHKWWMLHVPTRYLISFYAAGFICMAALGGMCYELIRSGKGFKRFPAWMAASCLLWMLYSSFFQYLLALKRRSYEMIDMAAWISAHTPEKGTVLGPWAASCTWGTQLQAIPVWKDYLNFVDIEKTWQPDAVITELLQEDSSGAFAADGFNLHRFATDSADYKIVNWAVRVYVKEADKNP